MNTVLILVLIAAAVANIGLLVACSIEARAVCYGWGVHARGARVCAVVWCQAKLEELIAGIPSRNSLADSDVPVVAQATPACPQCGTAMIQRTAKKGQFAGQLFWGCGRYPKCTGILKIS